MSSSTDPIALPATYIPKAGEMLARTFHNDPMMCHLLPNAAKRPSLSARSYQCLLRYGIQCGEVLATSANLEGVAIWLPPEATHGSLAKLLRACLFTLPLMAGPKDSLAKKCEDILVFHGAIPRVSRTFCSSFRTRR
jgi:hypothetical protein